MKIKLENTFITDNTLECEKGCFFLKTEQNKQFENEALKQECKIIDVKECKKILNIDENIKIIGITGTNGKTTTAAAIYSILLDLGYKCGLCGTRGAFINDEQIDKKSLTTSAILKTLEYLKIATQKGCEFFVMEVSSHALVQNRIEGLKFAAKIFTNITQDHLDFHQNFENYKQAKELFFTDESLKFINKDALAIKFNVKNAFTYGIENPSLYQIKAYSLENGINAIAMIKNTTFHIESPMLGLFNLYNLLAASACVNELIKPNLNDLEKAINQFGGVCGRVEQVADGVIIDFAHTPDGIEKVLDTLKNKKLIVVFGAGGNRDRTKRPLMGKVVEHFAKTAIITSDNPRDEDPKTIIEEIANGFKEPKKALMIEDRKEAIKKALELKEENDLVVILGKGDEETQEIKGIKYPFSDKLVVNEILRIN
ncbi:MULTISPECIES: UDP-N-acetylmuramoyl-L-alanyl-D-glutamate--2,6-diaminopimelate ligase [Campylobacter]|uniref:UDP-N-acetylmuramoyl-L-alanyl-D-glutamate--2, 6-diaminopimelate ligase n=1 Tax=Campylobacter molothri TaxID=1032242 RepID=A0ACC5W0K3_9BACT|nr:UDP-N-acetylmuramoyl-L-alanyl-D-glutamate--2,6-diaminopimelate ligase [Campylobacter sp. RM10537]MBZ7928119.1 UDP-N-acetylmuramoyl-L-alanyl-D-glutamate--2,6-diaminopimelate ligase [Campylobacter sp. RM10542]MBZ7947676.1 UDP-N-acetylmuramoyl-L-alanyl-D-glutamate--2,6-diaminopimelate ligase [Campylobacter sp. RM9929]MBZ7948932.1 UDP-N-acetylmuramoyl-L-alanyl-D-glutamate--2,6-diaminopimelate ligase [Campylobacter sp. RM10534]MBZ7957965.1 UDP-N-acetylmuramoyl-L-alanyl-D-glutamate--2,6-diaminopim